jgi:hypothetical protein
MTPSPSRLADFETWTQTVPAPVERTLKVGVLPAGRDALLFGATGDGRGIAAPTVIGAIAAMATRMVASLAMRMART